MKIEDFKQWKVVSSSVERLDVKSVPEFRESLLQVIAEPINIVLDLDNTKFIDSTGVGSLLQILKVQENNDCRLVLTGIHEQVGAMFKLIHMEKRFEIADSYTDVIE